MRDSTGLHHKSVTGFAIKPSYPEERYLDCIWIDKVLTSLIVFYFIFRRMNVRRININCQDFSDGIDVPALGALIRDAR